MLRCWKRVWTNGNAMTQVGLMMRHGHMRRGRARRGTAVQRTTVLPGSTKPTPDRYTLRHPGSFDSARHHDTIPPAPTPAHATLRQKSKATHTTYFYRPQTAEATRAPPTPRKRRARPSADPAEGHPVQIRPRNTYERRQQQAAAPQNATRRPPLRPLARPTDSVSAPPFRRRFSARRHATLAGGASTCSAAERAASMRSL